MRRVARNGTLRALCVMGGLAVLALFSHSQRVSVGRGSEGMAFVTPPAKTSIKDVGTLPAAAAAQLAVFQAMAPAMADQASPLAHGAPGIMEEGDVQGLCEKAAFASLLASTVMAWWRSTVGSSRSAVEEKPASFWALLGANASLVVLLSARWYESGHFPLSNMYESLMFLAWSITAVTIYFFQTSEPTEVSTTESVQRNRNTSNMASVWASPTALGVVAFATLSLPKDLQKASALVPALQSNWLVMHVSVVMLSYATLMFGSLLCMAVLALKQPEDSPIRAVQATIDPLLRGVADFLAPQPQTVPATSPQTSVSTRSPAESSTPSMEENVMQMSATASATQVATASGGSMTVEFSKGSAAPRQLTEEDQLSVTLDDLAYRALLLGFGFLTIGIISGAVWANEAWGSYWSWDPKETWALICWLVYAFYLHVRLQAGWDMQKSAFIGAFGFFVVWLCYIGVNLMGVGLHSYGFFLK